MKKLSLKNVTLIAMTSVNINKTIMALLYSSRHIEFGEIVLVTHERPRFLPKKIHYKHIEKIDSINAFNRAMVYDFYKYFDTEFALLVHADGFVVNPDMWQDRFLDYDYIGSPFPLPADDFSYRDAEGNIVRVGNSVSIRSRRLCELPDKLNMPWVPYHGYYHEDGFFCVNNKLFFEKLGMKFAPLEVAVYFGHESMIPEIEGIKPFVFHKWSGTNKKYPRWRWVKG